MGFGVQISGVEEGDIGYFIAEIPIDSVYDVLD
jgi:hypothetical protein